MSQLVYKHGNIFDSKCEALVNPVNCVGVMGGGLAKEFKHRYPDMYKDYRSTCEKGILRPGMIHVYLVDIHEHHILNFPTKDDWRDPSKMEYITTGLRTLKDTLLDFNMEPVAIPALGCGLGGLEWGLVKEEIERVDWPANLLIEVYPPQ